MLLLDGCRGFHALTLLLAMMIIQLQKYFFFFVSEISKVIRRKNKLEEDIYALINSVRDEQLFIFFLFNLKLIRV